jgi:hypothetical protein
MDGDKIEKQPTLPGAHYVPEKDYDYDDALKHFSQQSTAKWPSDIPPDAYRPDAYKPDAYKPDAYKPDVYRPDAYQPDATRTDHIENIETRHDSNVEYPAVVPLTRRQKTSKHLKRYWICYVLLGIVGLAVGLPIFFCVILPAVAQRLVNSTNLPIHSTTLNNPTADTITVSLVASLKVPLGMSVSLATTSLHLYRPETKPFTPYLTVTLPAQKLKGNATIAIENQVVKIENMVEFLGFLTEAVYAEEFVLNAKASTTAHLGAIKIPLKLNKGVKLKGLNQLKGFNILQAQVLTTPDADGNNFKGVANLPNPSIVAFQLGDEVLDLMTPAGLVLGQGTIKNASLVPGNNTVSFGGIVDYATIFGNLEGIINAESDALTAGNIGLNARGNSTIYKGHHVSYYESILNNMTLSAQVPVTQLVVGSVGGLLNSSSATLGELVDLVNGGGLAATLFLCSCCHALHML